MDEAENNRLADLLIELAKGNHGVLSDIALIMQKILYSIGFLYYKNKEDTDDSIQELYVTLYRKAKFFRKGNSASAWIVAVYKNLVCSQLRKRKREQRYIQNEIQNLKSHFYGADEDFIDAYLQLKELLDSLNEYERSLIIYSQFCHYTVREIARLLGKPSATVEYHLKKLKTKVNNYRTKTDLEEEK